MKKLYDNPLLGVKNSAINHKIRIFAKEKNI